MDIKIIIATHKKYQMPENSMYIPVHVGREGKEDLGYIGDNTGENISEKNYFFNELTGLFWAWKNLEAEYVGLAHYRRYFSKALLIKRIITKDKIRLVIDKVTLENLLKKTDVILPYKRKYYIETIESHYRHLPYTIDGDIDELRNIISTKYPEYINAFELVMKRRWAHMFNMFVMKREYFDEFCEWVFPIMFEVDGRISHEGREPIQNRLYISEFMIDTWIETKRISYMEVPVVFTENQHIIKKAITLISRKIGRNA